MSHTENEFGERAEFDPADVADYDARTAAREAAETARQQERAAAEEYRQSMVAGADGARISEARRELQGSKQDHEAQRLEYVSLAEQQRGRQAEADRADLEAGQ
jgi:hypothetical protein